MITWTLFGSLALLLGVISFAFAQTNDDLASVLENAEKSLKNSPKPQGSPPQSTPQFTLPPNSNLGTKMVLQPDESIETYYHIPPKSNFTFSPGSRLCAQNPCEQEFFDGVFRQVSSFPDLYFFEGILKIVDKSTTGSDPNIRSWLYYPFDSEFVIKSTKENVKTGNTVEVFTGDLWFDKDKLRSALGETHDIQYSITGTFEKPSNVLTIVGKNVKSTPQ